MRSGLGAIEWGCDDIIAGAKGDRIEIDIFGESRANDSCAEKGPSSICKHQSNREL